MHLTLSRSHRSRVPVPLQLEILEDRCVPAATTDLLHTALVPNDPSYRGGGLWGLSGAQGIHAPAAWDRTTGSSRVVVGVIDTGIDYTHPDLYQNVWLNQGEIPATANVKDADADGLITFYDLNAPVNRGRVADSNANGRIDAGDVLLAWSNRADNDGNGYVDDLVGWDFINHDNDPFDDNGHGTLVAGTIGATGNNALGVVGVNWRVQIAALKFLDAQGQGLPDDAAAALRYAITKGIPITNNSWGGGGYNASLASAIEAARARGMLFVAAAGNEGRDSDTTDSYPGNYTSDNVVSVAALTSSGTLASYSNRGARSVDLAAPGSTILSTYPGGMYASASGTSLAAPYVSGVAALLLAQNPTWTYRQVLDRLFQTAARTPELTGRVATGRLDAGAALGIQTADVSGARVVSSTLAGDSPGSVRSIRLTFSEAINPATFTIADITSFTLTTPAGSVIDLRSQITLVRGVNGTGNRIYDLFFRLQTAPGTYRLTIGPDIRDRAGNRLDQNHNGVTGETADRFTATFTLGNVATLSTRGVGVLGGVDAPANSLAGIAVYLGTAESARLRSSGDAVVHPESRDLPAKLEQPAPPLFPSSQKVAALSQGSAWTPEPEVTVLAADVLLTPVGTDVEGQEQRIPPAEEPESPSPKERATAV